jgi:hypothetical protein
VPESTCYEEIIMGAEPYPSFPHNTLWRKLQRRYFLDRFSIVGAVFACPPALCSVSWLLHGPLWFTLFCGACWFLTSLFMTFLMALGLISQIRRSVPQPHPFPSRLMLFWTVCVHLSTLIALLSGRVDWAFYITFGLSEWSGVWSSRAQPLQATLRFLFALALCLAFAKHAAWMVVSLLIIQFLRSWCFRPKLREAIRRLPTRAEYVDRSREACAAGGG